MSSKTLNRSSLLDMPSEIQAARDEAAKMFADLKAEWDRRRDAAYALYFNEPAIVERDEKAHKLQDKVIAWEKTRKPKSKKKSLDMTKDQIARQPRRPEGARPTSYSIAMDCRDAALIRDEAIFRGVSETELLGAGLKFLVDEIRKGSR